MPYKIEVNQNKCIGCGACVAICPKSFKMEDEKSTPIKNQEEKVEEETIQAEATCPVQAISISKL